MTSLLRGSIAAACAAAFLAAAASAQPGPGRPEAAPGTAAPETQPKPPRPPQSLIGREVVNAQGQRIGTVKTIVGTQVIVAIEGAEGVTGRDVALPWEKLTVSGEGEKLRLQTNLTREQLKLLIPYRASGLSALAARPVP